VQVELAAFEDGDGDLGPSTVDPTDSHETSIVPVFRIGCSGESVMRNTQS
jgi:hypothetical protein